MVKGLSEETGRRIALIRNQMLTNAAYAFRRADREHKIIHAAAASHLAPHASPSEAPPLRFEVSPTPPNSTAAT